GGIPLRLNAFQPPADDRQKLFAHPVATSFVNSAGHAFGHICPMWGVAIRRGGWTAYRDGRPVTHWFKWSLAGLDPQFGEVAEPLRSLRRDDDRDPDGVGAVIRGRERRSRRTGQDVRAP